MRRYAPRMPLGVLPMVPDRFRRTRDMTRVNYRRGHIRGVNLDLFQDFRPSSGPSAHQQKAILLGPNGFPKSGGRKCSTGVGPQWRRSAAKESLRYLSRHRYPGCRIILRDRVHTGINPLRRRQFKIDRITNILGAAYSCRTTFRLSLFP